MVNPHGYPQVAHRFCGHGGRMAILQKGECAELRRGDVIKNEIFIFRSHHETTLLSFFTNEKQKVV